MHVPPRVIRPQLQHNHETSSESPKRSAHIDLELLASSPIPTEAGEFEMKVFSRPSFTSDARHGETAREHVAMVYGDVRGARALPVRVHSECMTSEVFGSLKCDCKAQLEWAMAEVARQGRGAILYLRQEGRGIGLANKIRAYALQARGVDTVDANRLLGLPDDTRNYEIAASMLNYLGVESIRLMTNNPEKVRSMRALGIEVDDRIPVVIEPNPFSHAYLETKRLRMAHELPERLKRVANGK